MERPFGAIRIQGLKKRTAEKTTMDQSTLHNLIPCPSLSASLMNTQASMFLSREHDQQHGG
jgi:hypothetical protein